MKYLKLALIAALAASSLRVYAEAPASQPGDETVVVKKSSLKLRIEVDGTFVPADATEIRIRPRASQGELQIVDCAAPGQRVKAGETLLTIDPIDLNRAIATAENELKLSQSNLEKTDAENKLAEQADALALKSSQADADQAQSAIKWFDDVDGKHMLAQTELGIKQVKDSISDQEDELDQLKKMYKSEELTNATADIVVKRAVRQLEQTKVHLGMTLESAEKTRKNDFPRSRQEVVFAAERAANSLEQLKVAQKQSKIQRECNLTNARIGVETAQKKLADLQFDLKQFTLVAPADGIVYLGQLSGEGWQNNDPKLYRKGEKVNPGQVILTLVTSDKMRLRMEIPEARRFVAPTGAKLVAIPKSLPGTTIAATYSEPVRAVGGSFEAMVDLGTVDPRISPGMKAGVCIDAGEVADVLTLPLGAVSFGKVKFDGKPVSVELGRTDGESVEIKSGLTEGQSVSKSATK